MFTELFVYGTIDNELPTRELVIYNYVIIQQQFTQCTGYKSRDNPYSDHLLNNIKIIYKNIVKCMIQYVQFYIKSLPI